MVRKTYRIVMRSLIVVVALAISLSLGFYAWISSVPRTLPALNPYIESGLSSLIPGYHFHIAQNIIGWDSEQHTLDFRAKDVTVENAQNEPVASFPEIKLNLAFIHLFTGKIRPTDLVILHPAFKLDLSNSTLPDKQGNTYQKIIEKLLAFGAIKPKRATLQGITISDANILVNMPEKDILIHIDHTVTTFKPKRIISQISATIEEKPVSLQAVFYFRNANSVRVDLTADQLSSDILKDFLPNNSIVQSINATLNAQARIILPREGLPIIQHYAFNQVTGAFTHPTFFIEPIKITNLSVEGSVDPDFSRILIDKFDANLGGATLHASGFIKQQDAALKEIVLEANATNVPIDDIHLYWPTGIPGPVARDWVVHRISKGTVPKAYAKLWVTEQDIAQKHLSPNSLEAKVEFTGGTVNYFDAYPPATGVKGVANFTGNKMDITITDGNILNSTVKSASVTIPDFRQHPAVVNITGEATGTPADFTAFFNADAINQVLSTELQKLGGNAHSTVKLAIPLIRPVTLGDMAIDINADTENASLPKLFGKYNISAGTVHAGFDGKAVNIAGKILANGAPVDFTATTHLPTEGKTTFDGEYTIKSTLTDASKEAFLLPGMDDISGEAPFTLTIDQVDGQKYYQLSANLDKASIVLGGLGWSKEAGEALRLELAANQAAGQPIQITQLQSSSPLLTLSGSGYAKADFSAINQMDIGTLKFKGNDLALRFTDDGKTRQWDIRGNAVDLKHARFGKLFNSSAGDGASKAFQANIALRRVTLKNGEEFNNVAGQIYCISGICQAGKFTANTPAEGTLAMDIKTTNNQTNMHLESNRADHIASALDIYTNMQGGKLFLDAGFSRVPAQGEQPAHNVVEGQLRVEDFRVTKTPILAKIATLASFGGIADLLNNKGIKFKRLRAPFRLENDVIYLKDAKAYGNSLGITAEGKIYTAKEELNLNGTFVPSYTVNNILGKLPVLGAIGDVLMGGEGQGILAVRYSVKGPYNNADVTVNPLSILTPGFLRNLFDVVDLILPEPKENLGKIEPAAGQGVPAGDAPKAK